MAGSAPDPWWQSNKDKQRQQRRLEEEAERRADEAEVDVDESQLDAAEDRYAKQFGW